MDLRGGDGDGAHQALAGVGQQRFLNVATRGANRLSDFGICYEHEDSFAAAIGDGEPLRGLGLSG